VTICAISGLLNDQNALRCGRSWWALAQELEPAFVHPALIPVRFREAPLERVRSWQLGSFHRFGVHQSGERLLPFARQEQILQRPSTSLTLIALPKESINVFHILFSGCWSSSSFDSCAHPLLCLLCPHSPFLFPHQHTTSNRSLTFPYDEGLYSTEMLS
jgi:hypothetical protein